MRHKKVFWLLKGSKSNGSSRIHGHNIHEALIKHGIKSRILHQANEKLGLRLKLWMLFFLGRKDLLILQKRKESTLLRLLSLLKLKGVRIAFVDCDIPICEDSHVKYFNYLICASNSLSDLYRDKYPDKNVMYIPDAVEYFSDKAPMYNKKAIFFGLLTEARINIIDSLRQSINNIGWELHTISNTHRADIEWYEWENHEVYKKINDYCVSLIPVDNSNKSKYKSSNRVLQSLALGNIVLCGDIESYREVIVDGVNGFICSDEDDWVNALKKISKPELRKKIIAEGFDTAQKYSMDKIILNWIEFLDLKKDT